jgi:hypothetical protein
VPEYPGAQFQVARSSTPEDGRTEHWPSADLWHMRNGYAIHSCEDLDAISTHFARLRPEQIDELRGKLFIAVQRDAIASIEKRQ